MFGNFDLADRMMLFIPLLLSLTVHEWAHAWSAWKLGDDTAKLQGRLSLNPIVHMDPIGTLLLPLLGFPFGWAKPVPFEPLRFRKSVSMRVGTMIVAAAGPISNVCLAAISLGALYAVNNFQLEIPSQPEVVMLLKTMVLLNVILAVFNMLPIPPLDGSHIAGGLVPDRLRPLWNAYYQLGPMILLLVIILPAFAGFSILGGLVVWIYRLLARV
jgi:Zn-dependent protease